MLGTPRNARIGLDGHAQRPGGRLEDGLGDVVAVAAVVDHDVQVAQRVVREGLPEVGHQFAVELADLRRGKLGLEDEVRPAAEVHGRGDERFFHRQHEVAVAADARPVAQGLLHRLAQADAHVLDRVVLIDVQIADGLDRQVEGRVLGQQRQHVVEEAHAGGDLRLAAAVERQFQFDVGFGRFALDAAVRGMVQFPIGWPSVRHVGPSIQVPWTR